MERERAIRFGCQYLGVQWQVAPPLTHMHAHHQYILGTDGESGVRGEKIVSSGCSGRVVCNQLDLRGSLVLAANITQGRKT